MQKAKTCGSQIITVQTSAPSICETLQRIGDSRSVGERRAKVLPSKDTVGPVQTGSVGKPVVRGLEDVRYIGKMQGLQRAVKSDSWELCSLRLSQVRLWHCRRALKSMGFKQLFASRLVVLKMSCSLLGSQNCLR